MLTSLQNAGRKASPLIQTLMHTLPRTRFDQPSQYRATGNILSDVCSDIRITNEDVNLESVTALFYNNQILNEYMFSYYLENARGLTQKEWHTVRGDILKDNRYTNQLEDVVTYNNGSDETEDVQGAQEAAVMHEHMQILNKFLQFILL